MARIAVRRDAFEAGRFPPVCCKTGERADIYSKWEFRHTPPWTWILILFGIFPFLIASAFATERFAGVLPMTTRAQDRLNMARRFAWGFGIAVVALAVIGFVIGENGTALAVAGALAVAWLITLSLIWLWSPNANLAGSAVELSHLHPAFVEAIRTIPLSEGS